jgi:hypothetical protein
MAAKSSFAMPASGMGSFPCPGYIVKSVDATPIFSQTITKNERSKQFIDIETTSIDTSKADFVYMVPSFAILGDLRGRGIKKPLETKGGQDVNIGNNHCFSKNYYRNRFVSMGS